MSRLTPTIDRIRTLLEQTDEIGAPERHAGHEPEIIRLVRVLIRDLDAWEAGLSEGSGDERVTTIARRADRAMASANDAGLLRAPDTSAQAADLRAHTLMRLASRGA